MQLCPLGIGAAFAVAPYGWACNLVDGVLLVDAAPQAALQLRRLGIAAAAALARVGLAEKPAGYEVPTSGGRHSK